MQNQITVDQMYGQIYATAYQAKFAETIANPENKVFFNKLQAEQGEEALRLFIDNLALTHFGYQVDAETEDATTDDIRKVYQAAKVMFAKHPGKTFEFDLESTHAGIGSPWCHQCETPEEWVICWSRRYLETDEGNIDFVDYSVLSNVVDLINELTCFVSWDILQKNLAYICYDNEELIKRLTFN